MNTTQNLTAAADELNDEQLAQANGGFLPIVYVGAVVLGAAIGAGISIIQGFADAHAAQSK